MLGVAAHGVRKRFADGTMALDGVNLTVAPGEDVVLLGPNGAGKSTLLRSIPRLVEITDGSITVGETETTSAGGRPLRAIRLRIGFVFQTFDLVESLSVFHNVLHGALGRSGIRGLLPALAPEARRRQVMACLDRVELSPLATRRAETLSGGQKQRLAIARMLMQEPELVLVDEPVASLDPRAGREVLELLWELHRERRLTVLCTLHQPDLARRFASRIVGLRAGRLVFDEAADRLSDQQLDELYAGDERVSPVAVRA